MLKKLAATMVATFALSTGAFAAGDGGHVENVDFSFDGPFGSYDQNQLQRGLQIYRDLFCVPRFEICPDPDPQR